MVMDTDLVKKIRDLISNDEALEALKLLNSVHDSDDFIHVQSRLVVHDKLFHTGQIDMEQWLKNKAETNNSILYLLRQLYPRSIQKVANLPNELQGKATKQNVVFISYSHGDANIARQVVSHLEDSGLEVLIDEEDMTAGISIMEFIQQSIKKSDVVVSILSSKSLNSGWVGQESIALMYAAWLADKKFIPVKLDDVAFDIDFQITAQENIIQKIQDLETKIRKLRELGGDSRAFDDDRNRLFELKNNLGQIIQRLKSVLMVDITGENFQPSMRKVLERINQK